MIELVTAADRSVGCKKRSARQSKVTNGVEYLMTHEFIRETDPLGIEDASVGNYQRILQRSSKGVARIP